MSVSSEDLSDIVISRPPIPVIREEYCQDENQKSTRASYASVRTTQTGTFSAFTTTTISSRAAEMKEVLIVERDETVRVCKWTFNIAILTCVMCSFQSLIVIVALTQHIYSFVRYRDVFKCEFYNASTPPDKPKVNKFLQIDVVIYDFGLLQHMWNISHCVANYMDGGYMRLLWCIGYLMACICTFLATMNLPKRAVPKLLFPLVMQQSIFIIGLLILSFSALPPLMKIIFVDLTPEMAAKVGAFFVGAYVNYFLGYAVWHYLWYLQGLKRIKRRRKSSSYQNIEKRRTHSSLSARSS